MSKAGKWAKSSRARGAAAGQPSDSASSGTCRGTLHPLIDDHEDARSALQRVILLPGVHLGYHAHVLRVSRPSVARWRKNAQAQLDGGSIGADEIMERACAITAEKGLDLARARGRSHLPYWSYLAMFEYRKRGCTLDELARMFRCSRRTVAYALKGRTGGYSLLDGRRVRRMSGIAPGRLQRP